MNFLDRLLLPDRLYWAWLRARRQYQSGDAWYDDYEISRFEANLDRELVSIRKAFERREYATRPLRPLPQPKRAGSDGRLPIRQTFWVSVRDQVAWLAVADAIGPHFDELMPPWSYGNRLHRTVWFTHSGNRRALQVGPYRSTIGSIYRSFRQSWPLYRRHIALTVRAMARLEGRPEDEFEEQALVQQENLAATDPARLPYLTNGFWRRSTSTVYRAHIDFKKFYPSARPEHLFSNVTEFGGPEAGEILPLLREMLSFRIDLEGVPEDALEELGFGPASGDDRPECEGIPTGLFTSGFLANVAMLDIDRAVSSRLAHAQVAHFRFVDDHTFLAPSPDALEEWLALYSRLIAASPLNVTINEEKTDPDCARQYLASLRDEGETPPTAEDWERDAAVDPKYPSPLMTATLTKISLLARAPFALFGERAQDSHLDELRFLLAARLPDDEVRDDTRMAFAAGQLSQLGPRRISAVPAGETGTDGVRDRNRRILQQILLAVRGHPDKLRLWTRAIEFCYLAGLSDLSWLPDDLTARHDADPHATAYLSAYIGRYLASLIIRAALQATDATALPSRARAAAYFLQAALATAVTLPTHESWWFSRPATEVLGVAAVAVRAIAKVAEDRGHGSAAGHPLQSLADARALDDIAARVAEAGAGSRLAVWTWWIERQVAPRNAVAPTPLWRALIGACDPDVDETVSVFAMYPRDIPSSLACDLVRMRGPNFRADPFWRYEILRGLQDRGALGIISDCDPLRILRDRLPPVAGFISLEEWTRWTAERAARQPHDPRVGEWTCLEIVRQAASLVGGESFAAKARRIHPANILVPESWTDETPNPVSWEVWRRQAAQSPGGRTIRFRTGAALASSSARVPVPVEPTDVWPLVYRLGVVLFGLLRHSFRPLPTFFADPSGRIDPATIAMLPVSSRTQGLLEGSLTVRARENVILELFQEPRGDTVREPRLFDSIEEWVQAAAESQDVLVDHQLSVHGSMPRQLVPRRLDQAKVWDDGAAEE